MARKQPLDQWDEEIVAMYVMDGMSQREIAKTIHWSQGFVARRLRANGVEMRPKGGSNRKIDPNKIKYAALMRSRQKTVPEIAAALGVAESTAKRYLERAGMPENIHQIRTHCANGHELTETNTYSWRNHRMCKLCRRKTRREYMQRVREKVQEPA